MRVIYRRHLDFGRQQDVSEPGSASDAGLWKQTEDIWEPLPAARYAYKRFFLICFKPVKLELRSALFSADEVTDTRIKFYLLIDFLFFIFCPQILKLKPRDIQGRNGQQSSLIGLWPLRGRVLSMTERSWVRFPPSPFFFLMIKDELI